MAIRFGKPDQAEELGMNEVVQQLLSAHLAKSSTLTGSIWHPLLVTFGRNRRRIHASHSPWVSWRTALLLGLVSRRWSRYVAIEEWSDTSGHGLPMRWHCIHPRHTAERNYEWIAGEIGRSPTGDENP